MSKSSSRVGRRHGGKKSKGQSKTLSYGWYSRSTTIEETQAVVSNRSPVGRNDKCPCDSGLKYKRCCGRR